MKGGIFAKFTKLVSQTNIVLYNDKKISLHDTRKLMLSVMIKDLHIDSRLADYCLEHSAEGVIAHYLDFHYEDKRIAFDKYWELIKEE